MKVNQVKCRFLRRGETGVPGENLSVQSREPTNSTHIWRRVWESNPGHIGGRRVLSPLRHPCTPKSSKALKENFFFLTCSSSLLLKSSFPFSIETIAALAIGWAISASSGLLHFCDWLKKRDLIYSPQNKYHEVIACNFIHCGKEVLWVKSDKTDAAIVRIFFGHQAVVPWIYFITFSQLWCLLHNTRRLANQKVKKRKLSRISKRAFFSAAGLKRWQSKTIWRFKYTQFILTSDLCFN